MESPRRNLCGRCGSTYLYASEACPRCGTSPIAQLRASHRSPGQMAGLRELDFVPPTSRHLASPATTSRPMSPFLRASDPGEVDTSVSKLEEALQRARNETHEKHLQALRSLERARALDSPRNQSPPHPHQNLRPLVTEVRSTLRFQRIRHEVMQALSRGVLYRLRSRYFSNWTRQTQRRKQGFQGAVSQLQKAELQTLLDAESKRARMLEDSVRSHDAVVNDKDRRISELENEIQMLKSRNNELQQVLRFTKQMDPLSSSPSNIQRNMPSSPSNSIFQQQQQQQHQQYVAYTSGPQLSRSKGVVYGTDAAEYARKSSPTATDATPNPPPMHAAAVPPRYEVATTPYYPAHVLYSNNAGGDAGGGGIKPGSPKASGARSLLRQLDGLTETVERLRKENADSLTAVNSQQINLYPRA
eukprot:PhF_6_TR8763/c0_g2_i1/m.13848